MSVPQAQITMSLPILRKGQLTGQPPVRRMQQMIKETGVATLNEDGNFGPKTEAAVRDFQQRKHLAVDGIVGKQTWTALLQDWNLAK
jgi:peptidoglycan hydrolase-like protein with peptidoglycan-binding domain